MKHSLNVEEQARALAAHWNVDVERAAKAGLLHDCAKGLTLPQMQQIVLDGGLRLDKAIWDSRALLHAPVGAYLAQRDYGLDDREALDAIRWHTTGRAHMTALEKIIYLADMIEPDRAPFAALPAIRLNVWSDLDAAMLLALRSAIDYIDKRGQAVHPDTLDALRWLEGRC